MGELSSHDDDDPNNKENHQKEEPKLDAELLQIDWNAKVTSLTYVDLSNSNLKVIPAEVTALTHVRTLDLSRNLLQNLPVTCLRSSSTLEVLDLSRNRLVTLPDWFNDLKRIRDLRLNHNPLGNDGFKNLKRNKFKRNFLRLRNLDLANVGLEDHFPEAFLGCLDLHVLTLGHKDDVDPGLGVDNLFYTLPVSIIEGFKSLHTLRAPNVQMSGLPVEFEGWQHLETLDLSHNRIFDLPSALVKLHRLETLDMTSNNLESLPHRLETMPRLETLLLGNNDLSWVTEELGLLNGTLRTLALYPNRLDPVEAAFVGSLKSLEALDLAGNDLSLEEVRDSIKIENYEALQEKLRSKYGYINRSGMVETIVRKEDDESESVSDPLSDLDVEPLGDLSDHLEALEEEAASDRPESPAENWDEESSSEWSTPKSKGKVDSPSKDKFVFDRSPERPAGDSLITSDDEEWGGGVYSRVDGTSFRRGRPVDYDFDDMTKYCYGQFQFCPSDIHAERINPNSSRDPYYLSLYQEKRPGRPRRFANQPKKRIFYRDLPVEGQFDDAD